MIHPTIVTQLASYMRDTTLASHAELGSARFALLEALLVYAIGGLFKLGFAQTVNASHGLFNWKTYQNPCVVLCE